MASVTIDKRTGNPVIRAYAGINPRTHKPFYVSETIPADSSPVEIEEAKERVDAKAAVTKGNVHLMTIQTAVEFYLDGAALDESLEASTLAGYRSYTKCHVVPRIGSVPYEKADAKLFSMFFRDLRKPKKEGGAELSQKTVKKIHAFLCGCFRTLKDDGITPSNPIAETKVADGDSPEARPLTQTDFAKLLGYLKAVLTRPVTCEEEYEEHAFATILWVDVHTGFRRGEISGLQRRHKVKGLEVNPKTGETEETPALLCKRVIVQIKDKHADRLIEKEKPKGKRAHTVTIDEVTDAYLVAHDEIQAMVLAERGIQTNDSTPIFAHADGSIFTPAQITELMKGIVLKLGLETWVHLHTLRHTHATYLLEQGEPIRRVQERLDHKDVSTTLQLYGHVLPGSDAATAKRFASTTENIMKRPCNEITAQYIPKCPRTGETCVRFTNSFLEK